MEKKIAFLVADHDKSRLESVRNLFQSKGYIVHTAETGGEAIEKSRSRPYNLALLATKLADKEDPEFLPRMRKFVPRNSTIMITDDSSSKDSTNSPNPGLRGYLISTFDPENLLTVVEEKLREQAEVELYRSVIPWTKP